jgi:hypothetical protein
MANTKPVQITRTREVSGYKWSIREWDLYCSILKAKGLPPPRDRFNVSVSFETKSDFESYYGDFEAQIPLLFQLSAGEFQIVHG